MLRLLWLRKQARFSLGSLFVLMLGVAIGYSLNLETVRLLFGASSEARMAGLPQYLIESPDVLLVGVRGADGESDVKEEHLVGPDGRISLGENGSLYVTGMTIEEARVAVAKKLGISDRQRVWVDVLAYNSKKFYVIDQVASSIVSMPITGNETVLDALAATSPSGGLAGQKITVARPSTNGVGSATILPVSWDAESGGIDPTGNFQLFPGDRVIIEPAAIPAKSNSAGNF